MDDVSGPQYRYGPTGVLAAPTREDTTMTEPTTRAPPTAARGTALGEPFRSSLNDPPALDFPTTRVLPSFLFQIRPSLRSLYTRG